jgi:hypothetical protein
MIVMRVIIASESRPIGGLEGTSSPPPTQDMLYPTVDIYITHAKTTDYHPKSSKEGRELSVDDISTETI